MKQIPLTAGFYPLHAFWGPDFDWACNVVHAINSFALEVMDLAKAKPDLIQDLSLRELLGAVDLVEAWNQCPFQEGQYREIFMVPADRLTAAVYTLLHFRLHSPSDDQDLLARFSETRSDGDVDHLLLVAVVDAERKTLKVAA